MLLSTIPAPLRKSTRLLSVCATLCATQSGQGLTNSDGTAIAALLGQPGVTKLVLADNNLGDDAALLIASELASNTELTYLSLHKNRIGDAGAMALANALENGCPGLTALFLGANPGITKEVTSAAPHLRPFALNLALTHGCTDTLYLRPRFQIARAHAPSLAPSLSSSRHAQHSRKQMKLAQRAQGLGHSSS